MPVVKKTPHLSSVSFKSVSLSAINTKTFVESFSLSGQVLKDVLTEAMTKNQQRQSDLRPGCPRLQCLRCRSEVTCQKEAGEQEEREAIRRRMRKAFMLSGGEEEQDDDEEETDRADDGRGEGTDGTTTLKPLYIQLLCS